MSARIPQRVRPGWREDSFCFFILINRGSFGTVRFYCWETRRDLRTLRCLRRRVKKTKKWRNDDGLVRRVETIDTVVRFLSYGFWKWKKKMKMSVIHGAIEFCCSPKETDERWKTGKMKRERVRLWGYIRGVIRWLRDTTRDGYNKDIYYISHTKVCARALCMPFPEGFYYCFFFLRGGWKERITECVKVLDERERCWSRDLTYVRRYIQ